LTIAGEQAETAVPSGASATHRHFITNAASASGSDRRRAASFGRFSSSSRSSASI
jgi:hypothetical protein